MNNFLKIYTIIIVSALSSCILYGSLTQSLVLLQRNLELLARYTQEQQIKITMQKPLSLSNSMYPTFVEWYTACHKNLPAYIATGTYYAHTTLNEVEFNKALEAFFEVHRQESSWLRQPHLWVENSPQASDELFGNTPVYKAFVQKLVVDTNSIIALHGDHHGDIHSLLAYLLFLQKEGYLDKKDAFKIVHPNFYMSFLGDYVDRGNYGLEVIYTLLRLKIANPNRVFLVRGNHEDGSINGMYGFETEVKTKFKQLTKQSLDKYFFRITHLYDFMPVALYLGSGNKQQNFIQCCHGGMEIGYQPLQLLEKPEAVAFQWLTQLNRNDNFADLQANLQKVRKSSIPEPTPAFADINLEAIDKIDYFGSIGFMWNDFIVDPLLPIDYIDGRGYQYGKAITEGVLQQASTETHRIRGVIRAHQHASGATDMMRSILHSNMPDSPNRGVSKLWESDTGDKLWDGIVCTFLVSPDTAYSREGTFFDYDAFALLTTAQEFNQWRLQVYRTQLNTILSPPTLFNLFDLATTYLLPNKLLQAQAVIMKKIDRIPLTSVFKEDTRFERGELVIVQDDTTGTARFRYGLIVKPNLAPHTYTVQVDRNTKQESSAQNIAKVSPTVLLITTAKELNNILNTIVFSDTGAHPQEKAKQAGFNFQAGNTFIVGELVLVPRTPKANMYNYTYGIITEITPSAKHTVHLEEGKTRTDLQAGDLGKLPYLKAII